MGNEYLKTKKYIILILLLIGSLNCGTTVVGYNFIEKINILLNNNFNTKYPIDKIIYLLVALAGILLVINRDLWLVCIEDFTTSKSKTSPPPGIPTNIVLSQVGGASSMKITWGPPVVPPNPSISHYILYIYQEINGNSVLQRKVTIDESKARTYQFGIITGSMNYIYFCQLQTVNIINQSSPLSPKIYTIR